MIFSCEGCKWFRMADRKKECLAWSCYHYDGCRSACGGFHYTEKETEE